MASLELARATVRYGERMVLREVSFSLAAGERVALIGPNGSGKTTLLRALAGLMPLSAGTVRPAHATPRREMAKVLAYVPQEEYWEFPFPVVEVVACGRYAHSDSLFGESAEDREAVDAALKAVDMTLMRDRPINAISGGVRRRAILARALLGAVREYRGAVLFATHDLDAAAAIADRIVVLADGEIVTEGPPRVVLTESLLADVFGVKARVIEEGGHLHVLL